MKQIAQTVLFTILTALLLSAASCRKTAKNFDKSSFRNDSGFVSLKNGKDFLIELNKNDTLGISVEKLNENDTIGKYYKKENSPNTVMYLNDVVNTKLAPSQFLLEIDPNGNIIKSERYINGNYLCCRENKFDGFGKINDYFFLKVCGTGSAYCSGSLYVFKEITPQNDLNEILQSLYSGMCVPYENQFLSCRLTSKIETRPNSLVFHYKYDKDIETESNKFKTKMTENFDVEYISKDNKWIALDSTKLNQIDYY
ncbi:hypothetical protein [Flavobacterium pedocola]